MAARPGVGAQLLALQGLADQTHIRFAGQQANGFELLGRAGEWVGRQAIGPTGLHQLGAIGERCAVGGLPGTEIGLLLPGAGKAEAPKQVGARTSSRAQGSIERLTGVAGKTEQGRRSRVCARPDDSGAQGASPMTLWALLANMDAIFVCAPTMTG